MVPPRRLFVLPMAKWPASDDFPPSWKGSLARPYFFCLLGANVSQFMTILMWRRSRTWSTLLHFAVLFLIDRRLTKTALLALFRSMFTVLFGRWILGQPTRGSTPAQKIAPRLDQNRSRSCSSRRCKSWIRQILSMSACKQSWISLPLRRSRLLCWHHETLPCWALYYSKHRRMQKPAVFSHYLLW